LGLDKPEKIISILERESSNEKTIDKLIQFDVEEIQELLILCKNFQIKNKILQFDPTLARGLDYYTGLIFEVVEKENEFGTLCAGGRYDNLCGLFSERNFSGVGVSFGFERIMMAIGKKGSERWQRNQKTVLVTLFDSSPESIGESIKIYRELIKANIKSELYLDSQKLSRQFNYADKKGFQFVLVRGENERKNNEITVKNMRINKQKTIPFEQLTHYIKGFFSSN
jgi:histidyl-tRNA synthetase